MRVLIASTGSHGDIHPFVALGSELRRRGHEVIFFANGVFEPLAAGEGLTFVPLGTAQEYETVIRNPDLTHPRKGLKLIARMLTHTLPEAYRQLDAHVRPGKTLLIGSTLTSAIRLIQEKRGVPTVTVHLSPSIFRSVHQTPSLPGLTIPNWYPKSLKRRVWKFVDRVGIDPIFCPGLNRFRTEIGLPPVSRIFHDWIHSPDLVVGLFPDWFGTPQPDWPPQARFTGFPRFDQADATGLPDSVRAFLGEGPPPVAFTTGTATATAREFFAESVDACRGSGRRGLLLTKFPEQLPQPLPDSVRYFDYVPFSQLLPHAAAFVHHGGIGTLSQALRAGVPQLIRPMAFDQPDNAARLKALGVAQVIPPRQYRASKIADALSTLLDTPSTRETCLSLAERLRGPDPIVETCTLILDRFACVRFTPI